MWVTKDCRIKLCCNNYELKEKISKLENDLKNSQKETILETPSNADQIIKEYDHNF